MLAVIVQHINQKHNKIYSNIFWQRWGIFLKNENFIWIKFKPVINNDEEEINRAFSHGTVIVPIAQQIPTNFNRNIQQPINNLQKQTTKQKIQRNRNQQHGTVQRNQNIQYQQQPQYTFVQQPQNYIGGGGFYGGEPNIQKQQYPIPRPPPTIFQPLEIQKEQQFNQFQPFIQQSYQPVCLSIKIFIKN